MPWRCVRKDALWQGNLNEFLVNTMSGGMYLPNYTRKVVTADGFTNLRGIPSWWEAGRKAVWVWWWMAAWPQQSPDGGRRPDAGIAFKFPRSWRHAGSPQPGCKTPEVSCDPCWVGCSDFSLRKSCCMTVSCLVAGTHVLQKCCGTRLQLGKCLLPCLLWVQGALGEPWVAFAAQLAVYHCGVMERGEADKGDARNWADKFALGFGGQPLCGRCSFHMASVFALKGFVWICFQCPSWRKPKL